MLPGRPLLTGERAIRSALVEAFGDPSVSVTVEVRSIQVAASGELAHAWGTGVMNAGRTSHSKWLAVFRKRDGEWRAVVDIHNEG